MREREKVRKRLREKERLVPKQRQRNESNKNNLED